MQSILSKKHTLFLLLTIMVMAIALFAFYAKVLVAPGNYLFSDTGDGIKNYYTTLYHIKHDTSYAHFTGMHYPYGEIFPYTDGQPALAWPFKYFSSPESDIAKNVVATTNFLMLISILISAVFLYLILVHFGLPHLYSCLGAIGISLLSPQVFRMGGHYALSYAFFFPLTWYLLIAFFKNYKIVFSLLLFATGLVWSFLHPYLGMISGLFVLIYWVIYFAKNYSKNRIKPVFYIHAFIQSIFPLLIYKLLVTHWDTHVGRTSSPWGMFAYNARAETVFIPNHAPFKPLVEVLWEVKGQSWEGWAYIGVSAVIIAGLMLYRLLRYGLKKRFTSVFLPSTAPHLRYSLFASLLVLLFSMAYPFQLGMHFLLDWFPFFKQFRSLGRFAWVFYYVFNVFSLYMIYRVYRYMKIKSLKSYANTLLFFTFLFYVIESIPYHKEVAANISRAENYFDAAKLPQSYSEVITQIDKEKYQAIIPLPFYHGGSENFGIGASDKSVKSSQLISYHTGLPMLAASLARTSIPESRNIMQFFAPGFYVKPIEKDFLSEKDFLILYTKEELNEEQKDFYALSNPIYENEDFVLAELVFEKAFSYNSVHIINKYYDFLKGAEKKAGFDIKHQSDFVVYNDFESTPQSVSYSGKGSFKAIKKDYSIIWESPSSVLQAEEEYILSFWYYNEGESRTQTSIILEQKNIDGTDVKWDFIVSPQSFHTIDGDWTLVNLNFKINSPDKLLRLLVNGDQRSNQEIYIDNLLVRKKGADIYKVIKEDAGQIKTLFLNNHIIHFDVIEH
jgi:hypothetical protein